MAAKLDCYLLAVSQGGVIGKRVLPSDSASEKKVRFYNIGRGWDHSGVGSQ